MSWVKLDDQFFSHPKILDLPKDAKLLYLAALTHSACQLTDGVITPGALRVVAATVDVAKEEAEMLCAAGLWEKCETGWLIHDYHDYQPTRESALAIKLARSEAGSRGGAKSAQSKLEANTQANTQANVKQTPKQTPKQNPTPSPSPSPSPYLDPDTPAGEDSRARGPGNPEGVPRPPVKQFETIRALPPPTEAECRDYFDKRSAAPLAEKFWTRYQSVGWVIQGNPITDWQARARQWITEEETRPQARGKSPPLAPGQSALGNFAEREDARLKAIFEKGSGNDVQRLQ